MSKSLFQKLLWVGALSTAVLLTPFVLGKANQTSRAKMPHLKSTETGETASTLRSATGAKSETADASNRLVATNAEILQQIADSQVVYLAETHNDPADHAAQLEIIQTLAAQGDVTIGLEMFQRPFQPVLDAYLAGEITEEVLIADSEYETRWGFDWALYAPIVRYAQKNQIPLIALNTPAEVTRKVATEGLGSLSGDELTHVPAIADIDLSNQDYKASLQAIFGAHGGAGHSLNFDNFFAAQVLWDETMAEQVAQQRSDQPERQVVVLAGEGHILYDYGIPSRVARRLPNVSQSSVRLMNSNDSNLKDATDFVWITGEP